MACRDCVTKEYCGLQHQKNSEEHSEMKEILAELHTDVKAIRENHLPHMKEELMKVAVIVGGVVAIISFIATRIL